MDALKDNLTIKIRSGITVGELRNLLGTLTHHVDECIVEQDYPQIYTSPWYPSGEITYSNYSYDNYNKPSDED